MRGWLTRTWAQVTAAAMDRASTGTQLVLRLCRSLAGVADSSSNLGRATSHKHFIYIHESIGEPYDEMGEVGHWYVDPLAQRMYGPKTEDGWPREYITLLRGAQDRLGRVHRDMTTHYAVERIRAPTTWWLNQTIGTDL